ncbi:MAG: DUF2793 domain-containing protein [Pseudomonadota bacterium]
MARTYHNGLPLVQAAQAQKHVTLNGALARLDALVQLRVVSSATATPPAAPQDGESYIVAAGAGGDWTGRDGDLAIWANGAWEFLAPKQGWQAWDEAAAQRLRYSGAAWQPEGGAAAVSGAATALRIVEVDHAVSGGNSSVVAAAIPANMVVLGVSGRVVEALTGSATSWRLGVAGSDDRYGSGLGTALNSFAAGLTGGPLTYYAPTDLVLTGEGGGFSGGRVLLAVHGMTITPPAAV